MKLKKLVALATTAAMMLVAPLTMYAATGDTATGTSGETKVGSDQAYADTLTFKVTLPTSESMKFMLDPQGLYGYFVVSGNGVGSASDGDLASHKGKIVPISTNTAITNESSTPIVVTCDFSVSSNIANLALVDTISDNTAKQIKMQVQPGTVSGSDFTPAAGEDVALSKTASENQILFGVEAAEYEYKFDASGNYTHEQMPGSEEKVYFAIGGEISTDAEWTEFLNKESQLTLNCVFSYKAVKSIDPAKATGLTITSTGKITAGAEVVQSVTSGPTVSLSPTGVVTISGLTATRNFTSTIKLGENGQSLWPLEGNGATNWVTDNYSDTTGGTISFQLASQYFTTYGGKSVKVVVELTDESEISCVGTLNSN